jgi:murein DD-endopeptidase MepM/ murein hydrolase activator NlpD
MRPLRSRLLLAAPAVVLALALSSAVATGAPEDDRRQQLQDQIGEASAQEAAALRDLFAITAKKQEIEARVAELDGQVSAAEARLAPLAAESERLQARTVELQAEIDATQAELEGAQADFDESAAEMYRSARSGAVYDVVLAARPENLARQDKYLDRVSAKRRRIVQKVERLRAKLEAARAELADQKAQADRATQEAQAARDEVATLRAQIEPARAEAATQEAAEQAAIADIQSRKTEFESELAALQAASDSIAARLRAIGSGPGAPGHCEARPVPGPITSGFGQRYHPVLHYTRMHSGADMTASSGTPIHACRAGTVVIAGSQGGYGNAVVIDHGGGMATLYAHQSQIATSAGAPVGPGDVIGYVGSTGLATGPHLHFEVRLSGNPVDPAPYL